MGNRVLTVTNALLPVIVGVLSVTLWALPANAHNSLASSSPAADSTVARVPETVTLTFLSTVSRDTLRIDVTTPAGTREGVPAAVSGRVVTVALDPGPAGRYAVAYRLGSADGHPVKGRVTFTAEAPRDPAQQSPGPATPVPSVTPTPSAAAPSESGPSGPAEAPQAVPASRWPYYLGMVLLAAAIGAFTAVLVRRARRTSPDQPKPSDPSA